MLADLRHALRQSVKAPGFSLVVIALLAVGIGANTAIFSAIDAVLLRTLPVRNPQELVYLTDPNVHGMSFGLATGERSLMTSAEYTYLRDHGESFTGIAGADSVNLWCSTDWGHRGAGEKQNWTLASLVSGNYFTVLGVPLLLGHGFDPRVDLVRDASPVVVISYAAWQTHFGGDPAIIGKTLRLNDTRYDIIGVAAEGFSGETAGHRTAAWAPLTMQAEIAPGQDMLSVEPNPLGKLRWIHAIGRLKPGVSLAQAQLATDRTFQQYLQSQAEGGVPVDQRKHFLDQHLRLVGGAQGGSVLRLEYGEALRVLMILVALVLAITCANVANLLLTRATTRRKEIAIRMAIGAAPSRVFRQFLVESAFLSLAGGIAGLLLAKWGDAALLQITGASIEIQPDRKVLLFTFTVSILVGILSGTLPALRALQVDVNRALKTGSGGSGRKGKITLSEVLVVAQIGFSLMLVTAAGLFVHSFRKLAGTELGYDHEHVLIARVGGAENGYHGAALEQFYRSLLSRFAAVPGVRAVSLSENGLFTGGDSDDAIEIEGYAPGDGRSMECRFDQVGPGYFSTLGIPIVLGREIGAQDTAGTQRAMVLNQSMARYYFGAESPLGRKIRVDYSTGPYDGVVVGVVGDAKYNSVRESTPRRFYTPFFNPMGSVSSVSFELRTYGAPSEIARAVREAARQIDPKLVVDPYTLDEATAGSLRLDQTLQQLSVFFGILAALLAAIGIYALQSYAVARRTREIGIRMALGAPRARVVWLVVSQALALAAIGVLFGLPAAVFSGRLIQSLLYGLTSADAIVLVAATGLILLIALTASLLPARRATRVDPLIALRAE